MADSKTEQFKAYVCKSKGAKLELDAYKPQALGDYDVEIKVTHNGLCHTDIHMRDNDWGITRFPLVAGHEVVGKVVAVGSKVTAVKLGDRCGVGWIADSCRTCVNCMKGEENICRKGYTPTIVAKHGGFAERIRVAEAFAFHIPDAIPSAEAAPLLCAGITVYTPLRKYIKHPATTVAVWGLGGLGHMAVQFAHAMGAIVTVLSTSPDKEKEARSLGASKFVCWKNKDDVKALHGTQELIINTIPHADQASGLDMLVPDGVFNMVGIPATTLMVPVIPLVFGQKSVTGTIVGGRLYTQEMLELAAERNIRSVVQVMKLSQVNEAMDAVVANKARYRIVLENDF